MVKLIEFGEREEEMIKDYGRWTDGEKEAKEE